MNSWTLAFKDIRLLLRDKSALFWVLVFPLLIAILFGSVFGGSNGPAKIDVAVIDGDHSQTSRDLIFRLKKSSALNLHTDASSLSQAKNDVRKGDLSAYIYLPKGLGEEVAQFNYARGPAIQLGIDPSHQAEAGMLEGVTAQASYEMMANAMTTAPQHLDQYVGQIGRSGLPADEKTALVRLLQDANVYQRSQPNKGSFAFSGPKIDSDPIAADGKEPASSFEITFPQALIWGLLGVVSSFVISLVKEREQGTLVRLRSSMTMDEILAGKALACLLSCMGVMLLLLLIGHFMFHVRIGSPLLLLAAILSGSICIVGIMMLLSVLGRTEQAVSGSSWGVMIIMAMFGGGMIPLFMMPGWMQAASSASPLKWTVVSVEGAIWRGYSYQEMMLPCLILIGIGFVAFSIGVKVLRARG